MLTIVAVCFFFAATRRFGLTAALGSTAVFALATPLPSSTAQSLWSFTGEIVCLSVALHCLMREERLPAIAGLAVGAAFCCRPTALVTAGVLCVVLFVLDRRAALRFASAAALSVGAVAIWQTSLYGNPLGAYGTSQSRKWAGISFPALLGVLVSPSRGLLPFFPYVLLSPVAAMRAFREEKKDLLGWWLASMILIASAVLLAASHAEWWGGWSLGPRLMAECAPFLAISTIPLWRVAGWERRVLIFLVAFAALTQFRLAYNPDAAEWNGRILARMRSRSLTQLRESQLLAAWIPGWMDRNGALRDPLFLSRPDSPDLEGWLEAAERAPGEPSSLDLRGWAGIPGEELGLVVLLDGAVTRPRTLRRFPRPDVAAAVPKLGDCATCGFEATVGIQGLGGPHDLLVILRAKDGRIRRLEERHPK